MLITAILGKGDPGEKILVNETRFPFPPSTIPFDYSAYFNVMKLLKKKFVLRFQKDRVIIIVFCEHIA